jgi:isoaspartyl peptidase/L-asparaginase-like protein (Ntn-hydrolase superfamily)
MIIVASANGRIGIEAARRVLEQGGSALDAVEAGIREVEASPDCHTVGYSGYPNILGRVELDASIMDGATLTSGAVGALAGYKHPISVARKIMERLPHLFLVGEGAARFAREMGFQQEELLTEEARNTWLKRMQRDFPDLDAANLDAASDLWRRVIIATDPERAGGTVNFLAMDRAGDIAGGVSTSGWAWKYPGRLGDSPVIGAGLYADNRYGAAACTGMGEMAIQAGTARSLALYMKMGMSLEEAGREAMADLDHLGSRYLGRMNFVLMDEAGNVGGFSTAPGTSYIYWRAGMVEPTEIERTAIPIKQRWG